MYTYNTYSMASNTCMRLFEAELSNVKNKSGWIHAMNARTCGPLTVRSTSTSVHTFVSDIKMMLWSDKIYGFEDVSFDGRTLRATVRGLWNPTTILDCDSPLERLLFVRNPPSTPYGNWDNRVEYDTLCGTWTIAGMVQDCSCNIRTGRNKRQRTCV